MFSQPIALAPGETVDRGGYYFTDFVLAGDSPSAPAAAGSPAHAAERAAWEP